MLLALLALLCMEEAYEEPRLEGGESDGIRDGRWLSAGRLVEYGRSREVGRDWRCLC